MSKKKRSQMQRKPVYNHLYLVEQYVLHSEIKTVIQHGVFTEFRDAKAVALALTDIELEEGKTADDYLENTTPHELTPSVMCYTPDGWVQVMQVPVFTTTDDYLSSYNKQIEQHPDVRFGAGHFVQSIIHDVESLKRQGDIAEIEEVKDSEQV